MKRFIIISSLILAAAMGMHKAQAQEIKVYKGFENFKPLLHKNTDTTYVINFWATWCKPCVKELPNFQKAHEAFRDKKVKLILVSLDFARSAKKRVKDFINDREMTARVVILDDPDSNAWINKVSPSWSGSIPATLIYRDDKRDFYEKEFTKKELFSAIQSKTD